jgi:hypothetical protein
MSDPQSLAEVARTIELTRPSTLPKSIGFTDENNCVEIIVILREAEDVDDENATFIPDEIAEAVLCWSMTAQLAEFDHAPTFDSGCVQTQNLATGMLQTFGAGPDMTHNLLAAFLAAFGGAEKGGTT